MIEVTVTANHILDWLMGWQMAEAPLSDTSCDSAEWIRLLFQQLVLEHLFGFIQDMRLTGDVTPKDR